MPPAPAAEKSADAASAASVISPEALMSIRRRTSSGPRLPKHAAHEHRVGRVVEERHAERDRDPVPGGLVEPVERPVEPDDLREDDVDRDDHQRNRGEQAEDPPPAAQHLAAALRRVDLLDWSFVLGALRCCEPRIEVVGVGGAGRVHQRPRLQPLEGELGSPQRAARRSARGGARRRRARIRQAGRRRSARPGRPSRSRASARRSSPAHPAPGPRPRARRRPSPMCRNGAKAWQRRDCPQANRRGASTPCPRTSAPPRP